MFCILQNDILGSCQNNTILAVLFIEHEINNEDSEIFLQILRRLRYKLYDILCVLQYYKTITEEMISCYKNSRDGFLNGMLSDAHNYERGLIVVSAIKTFLQNVGRLIFFDMPF